MILRTFSKSESLSDIERSRKVEWAVGNGVKENTSVQGRGGIQRQPSHIFISQSLEYRLRGSNVVLCELQLGERLGFFPVSISSNCAKKCELGS